VHDIGDWADLRRRLDPEDRRCFAFFHPAMPLEPLIFVEVGLTQGIPGSIQDILATERTILAADQADTAVFYSISNCQPGLKGISFGHFLIKQVATELQRDLPGLDCFVTLSPIPGFTKWLRAQADQQLPLLEAENWWTEEVPEATKKWLISRAVDYFTGAKNNRSRPLDPVARFHLGNGALLERLNWLGDVSANGRRQSAGLMVNYRYDLPRIEENHEAYAERGEMVMGAPFIDMAHELGIRVT
jgi:malonyl-CoA decarboxylase